MILRIKEAVLNFLHEPAKRAMREKYPYKAGERAKQNDDDFNPYKEGTESHRLWQKGYDDQNNHEMTIW